MNTRYEIAVRGQGNQWRYCLDVFRVEQRFDENILHDLSPPSYDSPENATEGADASRIAILKGLATRGTGEPVFLLRGTDPATPGTIRNWASQAGVLGVDDAKVKDALSLANEIEVWQEMNPSKVKIPDGSPKPERGDYPKIKVSLDGVPVDDLEHVKIVTDMTVELSKIELRAPRFVRAEHGTSSRVPATIEVALGDVRYRGSGKLYTSGVAGDDEAVWSGWPLVLVEQGEAKAGEGDVSGADAIPEKGAES